MSKYGNQLKPLSPTINQLGAPILTKPTLSVDSKPNYRSQSPLSLSLWLACEKVEPLHLYMYTHPQHGWMGGMGGWCACTSFSILQLTWTCVEYSYLQYFFLSSSASGLYWRIRTASMMADHVGGGSTCFSHSFNISLKHFLDSWWSFFIALSCPCSRSRVRPMSSQSADTLLMSSFSNWPNFGGEVTSGCLGSPSVILERFGFDGPILQSYNISLEYHRVCIFCTHAVANFSCGLWRWLFLQTGREHQNSEGHTG